MTPNEQREFLRDADERRDRNMLRMVSMVELAKMSPDFEITTMEMVRQLRMQRKRGG